MTDVIVTAADCGRSTSRRSARTSRSSAARSATAQPLVYLDSARHLAEAAPGARRRARRTTSSTTPTCTAACTRSAEEATDAYEGARDKVAAFIGAPSPDEVDLHQERHRGAEPGRLRAEQRARLGRSRAVPARPGRRDRDHRDGAPLQHRAVAAACAAHRRDAALVRADRRRPARPDPTSTRSSTSAPRSSSFVHQSNMLGTVNPVDGDRPRGPSESARWWSSTPRSRCRTCRSTCRRSASTSSAFTGAQDARPDRHRRALGPPRAARGRCRRSSAAAR